VFGAEWLKSAWIIPTLCLKHNSIYHSGSFVIAKLLISANIDNNLARYPVRS